MKLLQLHQLDSTPEDSIIKDSFDNLPRTGHKDGKYRLRRYSVIKLSVRLGLSVEGKAVIKRLPHREFEQGEEYNEHQGGMIRDFEEVEDVVLQSKGMKDICLTFKRENDLIDGQEIDIHQMRVVTQEDGTAKASPEGTHQDGFDCIAMVGVNRQNISGGELMVYENKDEDPLLTHALKSGEMALLNDREMWHNATPVKAVDSSEQGFGDWFILCATK